VNDVFYFASTFTQVRNVDNESQILVKLAKKKKKESWAAHSRHFIQVPS